VSSVQKINANRTNARASTRPKTRNGRIRSARNALRHALSLPVESDPELAKEVVALAREIAGAGANAKTQELARQVADAQIDLRRIRRARYQLLLGALHDPHYESRACMHEKVKSILRLLGRKRDLSMEILQPYVASTPQGPHKFATIIAEEAKRLSALDRYERRALSRRQSAIRAFDEARRRDRRRVKLAVD
jgi:hypothetical protein